VQILINGSVCRNAPGFNVSVFRPFGAGALTGSYPGLAPWAAILRRLAARETLIKVKNSFLDFGKRSQTRCFASPEMTGF